jgi:rRNA maturation endonuclease Nob1
MMTLTIRKIIVLGLIGMIFLMANILVVANWLAEKGLAEKANWLRDEFLTGTAIAVILVLLILLVNPKNTGSRAVGFVRRCPVCDKRLIGNVNYCGECGSKV